MQISDETLRCFLFISYGFFVGLGCIGLTMSTVNYVTVWNRSDMSIPLEGSSVLGIVSGLIYGTIGVLGVLGLYLNLPILLTLAIGFSAVGIIIDIGILVVSIIAIQYPSQAMLDAYKARVIKEYGDNSNAESKSFTKGIDLGQKMNGCCGFSGDDADNIFLKTPWYAKINANVTNGKKTTVPDSCCLVLTPECRQAEDLAEARYNEYIYLSDCHGKEKLLASLRIAIAVLRMLGTGVLEGLMIAGTVTRILRTTEDASTP